ncbi:DUF1616 domain-containing protein [Methanocella paludicola]|nr:DUF1616 domain-containing protein [Methanocella paludicola]
MDIDLKLTIVLAFLALTSIYIPQIKGTALMTILGLFVVVVAPGYALVAALFPGKAAINGNIRIVISLGMSVIITALIGLVLNFTAWGIRLEPVAISLSYFSIIVALIANMRRLGLNEEDRQSPHIRETISLIFGEAFPKEVRFSDKVVTFVFLVSMVLSITAIGYVIVFPQNGEKYTEFYILGPDGIAENYTTNFRLGDNGTFIVGVVNHEQKSLAYNVRVVMNNGFDQSTLYTDQFTLANDQTLEKAARISPDITGTNMKLQFFLYADGNMSSPYRECHVWVNVTQPAAIS